MENKLEMVFLGQSNSLNYANKEKENEMDQTTYTVTWDKCGGYHNDSRLLPTCHKFNSTSKLKGFCGTFTLWKALE